MIWTFFLKKVNNNLENNLHDVSNSKKSVYINLI